jgi:hypothetical protein
MKSTIRELDWKTPVKSINMGHHWRIWLGILVFSVVSTAVWQALFPNTLWFLKLWTGFATGSVLGTFAGVCWQFRDRTRRALTSGKFLLMAFPCWGFFAVISLVMLAPQMLAEEAFRGDMRSLTTQNVISIKVTNETSRIVITDDKIIEQFCNAASKAELFYPSHEGSIEEYEISLSLRDNQIRKFRARVPERHHNDLSLDFRGPSHWTEILLPGGRTWLESAIGQGRNSQQPDGAVTQKFAPSALPEKIIR